LDKAPQVDPQRGALDRGEPVDLVPILSDLANDVTVLDPERAVRLTAPDTASVPGDRDQLTQLFAGLAANALRHTPTGTPIDMTITSDPRRVRVEIRDHGPGIAAADLPRVFDRFYRADGARARAGSYGAPGSDSGPISSGGSGLGLAIAAAIVKAHAGTIGVTSAPDAGATFWVELPTVPAGTIPA
jgi:two-component system OmpR family sensor kinase